ncbi:HAMP domain-containing histidine kinase [Streptacidiphilus sp. ASG 303]|uniref:sensor histidine kinase n=1 Tax=Streptacidiphilus sp. ASG 303 TaxID=2896847 RepID=UPI001E5EC07F|nr:HAMP domain-containing sensor histidine kinase [Streptacidiphilus sp. ASG 303]MCD0483001.1 HAMP domain-containing histidine kinase [Streptacidiphilus sp. ASG 303]
MTAGHQTSARRIHRAPRRSRPRLRAVLRRGPARWGATGDTAAVAAATAAALLLAAGPADRLLPLRQTHLLLVLAAAGTGAAAVGVAALTPRLAGGGGRPHPVVAAALLLHSLVLMPASVVDTGSDEALRWLAAIRFTASVCFVLLLAAALRTRPLRWARGLRGVLAAVAATAAGGLLGPSLLPPLQSSSGDRPPALALAAAWLAVSLAHLGTGLRRGDRLRTRLGLGLSVAAAAQLGRVLAGHPVWAPDLVSAALRLLGLLVVLAALTADFLHQADRVEGRLRASDRRARQAAERDHEMRNVLAGLSGAAYLLRAAGARLGPGEQAELGAAVQAELERLRELLARDGSRPSDDPDGHEVEPVLRRLVVLRRTVGADVELAAEPGLRTTVPASVLAQVASNLLANCERHAPGARVRVAARREGGAVLVEVADDGPGLAPGAERRVMRRGVRDTGAGGSGLGLYVSSRLLAEHGGAVRLLPRDPLRPGCTAVVELPAAGEPDARVSAA